MPHGTDLACLCVFNEKSGFCVLLVLFRCPCVSVTGVQLILPEVVFSFHIWILGKEIVGSYVFLHSLQQ